MWLNFASLLIWLSCPSFLSGCGTEHMIKRKSSPELLSYVTMFKIDARARGVKQYIKDSLLYINYVNFQESDTLGRCSDYDNLGYSIQISNKAKAYSKKYRRAIVYHEIAHCEYGLGHANPKDLSLMTSNMQSPSIIKYEWRLLMIDLFKRIKDV